MKSEFKVIPSNGKDVEKIKKESMKLKERYDQSKIEYHQSKTNYLKEKKEFEQNQQQVDKACKIQRASEKLMAAAKDPSDNRDAADQALDEGAHPNWTIREDSPYSELGLKGPVEGLTPLHFAALRGNSEICILLWFSAGADTTLKDSLGNAPCDIANKMCEIERAKENPSKALIKKYDRTASALATAYEQAMEYKQVMKREAIQKSCSDEAQPSKSKPSGP